MAKIMKAFRFDTDLYEALKVKAEEENRSVTNLIETILWNWVRSH
jgi:hypothetical protein